MAQINNNEVVDKIRDGLKLSASENIPNETEDKIKVVYVSNPMPLIKIAQVVASDATSTTIMTTSTTKRTFIVGANLSISKDAVNDGTNSRIVLTPLNGEVINLIKIRYEPTTAASNLNQVINIPPLELKKGTPIAVANDQATASIDSEVIIFFYEIEPL